MYLISIIVPVYNAEDYLENTINSVINQSIGFENLELLLINDNSSDNSKKIIDDYCEKYNNIVSFHSKENHGFPGFGRNWGTKHASADYLMFLDNDDEYDKDVCKKLYENIVNQNADLAACGRILVEDFEEKKDNYDWIGGTNHDGYVIFENKEVLLFDSVTIWNKIFKKEIINNNDLKFIENSSADDFAFSVDYHSKCNKIIHLTNYYGYRWNIRDESLSHDVKLEHVEEVLQAYQYLFSKNEDVFNYSEILTSHMIFLLVSKCSYLNVDLKDFKSILKKIHIFEKKINSNIKIRGWVINFANNLILHGFYNLTFLYFKILKCFRKSFILKKL